MRSTLFHIPAELWGRPVFGVGLLLAAWIVFAAGLLAWLWRRPGGQREGLGLVPFLAIIGAVIALVLPNMIEYDSAGKALGIPIRGFGVMLMLSIVCSVGLAAYRAWQVGIDPDAIYSLAFVMIAAGIVGARLFFIVQYWHEFALSEGGKPLPLAAMIGKLFNVTQGGLVVYGSVLCGLPAGLWYCRRRGLPLLLVADVIAPSMVLGQALGRLGCFLNGCCYGGVCLSSSLAVTFPAESPPYKDQERQGWHSAVWLEQRGADVVVAYVAPLSDAANRGVQAGDVVQRVNDHPVATVDAARKALVDGRKQVSGHLLLSLVTADGRRLEWEVPPTPARSVPVHPAQIYAAIDAGLLALVLWFAFPFRRRDGEIFALLVTIHPISRILLEIIRSDEHGLWGTPMTIAQWTSLGILFAAAALWVYIERQPRRIVSAF